MTISSAITCSGGKYPEEVDCGASLLRWYQAQRRGTDYTSSSPLTVAIGRTCTLDMKHQLAYADGLNGAEWAALGFGQRSSAQALHGGNGGTNSFVVGFVAIFDFSRWSREGPSFDTDNRVHPGH